MIKREINPFQILQLSLPGQATSVGWIRFISVTLFDVSLLHYGCYVFRGTFDQHTTLLRHWWRRQAESTKMGRSLILTGEKKPEKWLKVSCLLTGRTKTVRLFSLSVQERTTPPQLPELRTPSSTLEGRRVKRAGMPAGAEEAEKGRGAETGHWIQEKRKNLEYSKPVFFFIIIIRAWCSKYVVWSYTIPLI